MPHELKAGLELDAFMAANVMEWPAWKLDVGTVIDGISYPWHPSSDIAAAFQVAEEVQAITGFFDLWKRSDGESSWWAADFTCEGGTAAQTAPLAICLAAKKAVEK